MTFKNGQIFEPKNPDINPSLGVCVGVQDGIDGHHGILRDLPMLLLLSYCPYGSFSSEAQAVCTHERLMDLRKTSIGQGLSFSTAISFASANVFFGTSLYRYLHQPQY